MCAHMYPSDLALGWSTRMVYLSALDMNHQNLNYITHDSSSVRTGMRPKLWALLPK